MNIVDELNSAKIETLSDPADLYPYAYDTAPSADIVLPPVAVAFPKSASDVQVIVKLAKKYKLKIISRGAGTCHTSGCKPTLKSLVVHFSKMNRILEINKENLTAIVEPGVITGQLQNEVDRFNLFFPPDPSNLKVSTIGGAVALNSGGARAFKYGTTKDYVLNLEVVLANGEILNTGKNVTKSATGYNLTSLFVGSEGTLGIITKITLKLIPKPETRQVAMAYFNSLEDAATSVNSLIDSLITPSSVDILDFNTIDTIEKFNPQGLLSAQAMLLIELDGSKFELFENCKKLFDILQSNGAFKVVISKSEAEADKILDARRSAFACVARLKPNVVTEDVVVPRYNIVPLIKGIQKLADEYKLTACIMGHIGDGNIHPNFALDFSDLDEAVRFEAMKEKLFKLAVYLDGTLSGEHGVGSEKKDYLDFALDKNAYLYMKKIKDAFDPDNILNPELLF